MPKMTVSVPDELLEKLRKSRPEINWAEVVRGSIIKKIEELEKFEELKRKGVL